MMLQLISSPQTEAMNSFKGFFFNPILLVGGRFKHWQTLHNLSHNYHEGDKCDHRLALCRSLLWIFHSWAHTTATGECHLTRIHRRRQDGSSWILQYRRLQPVEQDLLRERWCQLGSNGHSYRSRPDDSKDSELDQGRWRYIWKECLRLWVWSRQSRDSFGANG